MKKILLLALLTMPLCMAAQQPKMFIKIFTGVNTNTFIYRTENTEPDVLAGLQFGSGFRVSKRSAFAELDITYVNYGVSINIYGDTDTIFDPFILRMNSLEVPLLIGYIPIKKPVFKWYLYGGIVNRFSLRGQISFEGEKEKVKPQDLGLHTYNLGARFGTQVDVAMLNFDFNYTIGVTNSIKGKTRTNFHALQLSIGYLF